MFIVVFSWHKQIWIDKSVDWWCTWDSNPGRQDGRRRQIHWAMASALKLLFLLPFKPPPSHTPSCCCRNKMCNWIFLKSVIFPLRVLSKSRALRNSSYKRTNEQRQRNWGEVWFRIFPSPFSLSLSFHSGEFSRLTFDAIQPNRRLAARDLQKLVLPTYVALASSKIIVLVFGINW